MEVIQEYQIHKEMWRPWWRVPHDEHYIRLIVGNPTYQEFLCTFRHGHAHRDDATQRLKEIEVKVRLESSIIQ